MDSKDEEILEYLKSNGRASYTDVAERVDVSEGTVRNRVRKMKENGVIDRFTVETSEMGSEAVVMVELETGRDIQNVLEEFPSGIDIKEVAGEYDLILEIKRRDNTEINSILDKIRSIKGVKSTETFMVLNKRRE